MAESKNFIEELVNLIQKELLLRTKNSVPEFGPTKDTRRIM